MDLELRLIRTDGGTQPRAAIDTAIVQSYAEDMANGAAFPPLVVFHDGVDYWLADGFHRFFAGKGCGLAEIDCDVRQGTVRDAVLFSVGANASHGLRRTNEDKRRAVLTLLNDPEWAGWSDSNIARQCIVSPHTVAKLRPAPAVTMQTHSEPEVRTFTTRHGTVAKMQTANIGRRPDPERPIFDASPSARDLTPAFEPAAPRPTPQQVQSVRDRMQADGFIADQLWAIRDAFARLPGAEDAARRFPAGLRHTIDPLLITEIAEWFAAFGHAWERHSGDANVAA